MIIRGFWVQNFEKISVNFLGFHLGLTVKRMCGIGLIE